MSFCSILRLIVQSAAAVSATDAKISIRPPQDRIWRDNRLESNNADGVQHIGWMHGSRITMPTSKVGWSIKQNHIFALPILSVGRALGHQDEYLFPAVILTYEI
jgi:hypothetical protein